MNQGPAAHSADRAASLEARFGWRIAASLNERRSHSDHDISERLRISRERALEVAKARRQAATATVTAAAPQILGITASGAAIAGGTPSERWGRLASVIPILLLLGALFAIDSWQDSVQINAAADVDAALLTDDLPPEAYADPGFVEYLRSPNHE